jgi:hypothetical protein
MKKLLTLYVTPLIGIILIALKIPGVDSWLSQWFTNATIIIGIFLAGATILNHLITVTSPFKKYERLEKNKWELLDALVTTYFETKVIGTNKISANVMVVKKKLRTTIEPKTEKYKWWHAYFRRLFDVMWVSSNGAIDKRLVLTTKQGVSGLAYKKGKVVIKDMTQGYEGLNLADEQIELLSGKGFIISYPIFAFDERYSRLSNKKIVGVVNFSCSNFGSEALINNSKIRDYLTNKIIAFSKICSLIM